MNSFFLQAMHFHRLFFYIPSKHTLSEDVILSAFTFCKTAFVYVIPTYFKLSSNSIKLRHILQKNAYTYVEK